MITSNKKMKSALSSWRSFELEELHAVSPAQNQEENMSPLRKKLRKIITHKHFEMGVGVVIFFNMVIVIFETDAIAEGAAPEDWILFTNHALLAVYLFELASKIYVYHSRFFCECWNVADCLIVGLDIVLISLTFLVGKLPSVSIFRIFRLIRLARAFRAAKVFPELSVLINGFVSAMKAIFWGVSMIVLILTIWSILAVQLLHPVNKKVTEDGHYKAIDCTRCPEAFKSVWNSGLTFFQQVVAGDSWGEVSLPVVQKAPWAALFLLAVLVSVNLSMLNLILAVICEAASEARRCDLHEEAKAEEHQMVQRQRKLLQICAEMDVDGSGSLSKQEILEGMENQVDFADFLKVLNIKKEDMEMVFKVLDPEGSGQVEYREFVDKLHRMKSKESQLILFYVIEILQKMAEQNRLFQKYVQPHTGQPNNGQPDKEQMPTEKPSEYPERDQAGGHDKMTKQKCEAQEKKNVASSSHTTATDGQGTQGRAPGIVSELRQLVQMRQDGLLSEQEFTAAKRKLLSPWLVYL